MGTKATKPKRELRKFDLEVTCDKIYQHLLINRDRKINELALRERDLRDAIKAGRKSYEDVLLEMISIVNLFKSIKASKMILRYCLILKDHSMQICEASRTKNMASIWEMETYFQGLIWATDKLNLTYIKEFNNLIFVHFGPEIFKEMQFFTKVDKELKQCYASIEPSPNEIKDYLEKFCARYDINDFGFGGKKQQAEPKNGGTQNTSANADLDAMLANLKYELNNNPNPNNVNPVNDNTQGNNFYQPGFVQPPYDPTAPPTGQNQGLYQPGYQQPGFNQGFQPPVNNQGFQPQGYNQTFQPAFPQPDFGNHNLAQPQQPSFPQQNYQQPNFGQNLPNDDFNYPNHLSSKPEVDQFPDPKLDEMNNALKVSLNNNYDDLGDEHIKALIESNIKKSYLSGNDPTKAPNNEGREVKTEEANLDDLIAKLKELGVTLPNQKVSDVNYDAQRYYKSSNLNVNDYKIDFDDNNPNQHK